MKYLEKGNSFSLFLTAERVSPGPMFLKRLFKRWEPNCKKAKAMSFEDEVWTCVCLTKYVHN